MVTEEKRKQNELIKLREKREREQQRKQRRRRSRRITALITLIAVVTVTFGVVYNASAKEITVTEINEFTGLNESQTIKTRSTNVEEVLAECGLDVSDTDRLNVPADKEVADKDDIVLTRGKRVKIKVGDHEDFATVTKANAEDALVEAGYIPGELDNITSDGNTIELVAVSLVDETVTEKIERGIEYVDDPNLPKGQEKVVDEGSDGVKEITHAVTYENGVEAKREAVNEVVKEEARSKVIACGTAEPTPAPKSPADSNSQSPVSDDGGTVNGHKYTKKITMTATAYSTDPSENAGYTTSAMGNQLGYGIVAVDPKVVPLGSKVYVTAADGSWVYGVASAEDTGGAIKGNRIDLCYPNNANSFGRRSCVVYVLE